MSRPQRLGSIPNSQHIPSDSVGSVECVYKRKRAAKDCPGDDKSSDDDISVNQTLEFKADDKTSTNTAESVQYSNSIHTEQYTRRISRRIEWTPQGMTASFSIYRLMCVHLSFFLFILFTI